jgi:hypothetical protein
MAFIYGTSGRILIDEFHVSGDISGYSAKWQRDNAETTSLLDSGTRGIPGLMSGSLNVDGSFDSTAGAHLYDITKVNVGVDNSMLVTAWPEGGALGKPAFIAVCDPSGFEIEASVSDKVSISIEGTGDDGVDWGYSYHDLTAESVTGNGTGYDDLPTSVITSANGGVGMLHVTAATGTGGTVKIQDSADNITFADIITFTATAAATSERKTVTGTVRRYIRSIRTINTTSSLTYGVSFARR